MAAERTKLKDIADKATANERSAREHAQRAERAQKQTNIALQTLTEIDGKLIAREQQLLLEKRGKALRVSTVITDGLNGSDDAWIELPDLPELAPLSAIVKSSGGDACDATELLQALSQVHG